MEIDRNSRHPLDRMPPGVRISGPAGRTVPIIITPEQHAETKRVAAAERERLGPNPKLEDLLDLDQIAEAMDALAARRADGPLSPTLAALRQAREAAGLTLAAAAARAGVAEATLGELEAGRAADPTWGTLHRCAAAVGLQLVLTAMPADTRGEPPPAA